MKNKFILSFAMAALLAAPASSDAQTAPLSYNGQEITVSTDTLARITLFKGIYAEGKTWLHWIVQGQQCDGLYVVYRSFDGATFEMIGQKKGIGVTVSAPIGWYLQDVNPPSGTTYYKLVHIGADQSYLASEKISVRREEVLLSTRK